MDTIYICLSVLAGPLGILLWLILFAMPFSLTKRIFKVPLALLLAFFCQFYWHSRCLETAFTSLHAGMTKSDVIRLMGIPKADSSDEKWSYSFYFASWSIEFDRNGVLVASKRGGTGNSPEWTRERRR